MPDPLKEVLVQRELRQPDMDLARAHLESQMPGESRGMRSLKPMGTPLWGSLDPHVIATTDIFNNVRYNPEALRDYVKGDQSRVDDVLAHELTHVGQNQRSPGFFAHFFKTLLDSVTKDYLARDSEQEAFDTMRKRMGRRRDIELK